MGGHLEHAAAAFSRSDQQLVAVTQRLKRLGEPAREDLPLEPDERNGDTARLN